VRLVVSDSGPGVRPQDRPHVFERYHTTRVGGTGLGLALTRAIVEAHGGTIGVDDAPGGGARFTIRLPRQA
jgi:signal transduction histidine kinase